MIHKYTDLKPEKIHRFVFFLLITFPLSSILWISCGENVDKYVDKQVFRLNLDGGLTTLDPAYARDQASGWMVSQVFEGLVALDEKLAIQPVIARNWNISPDGLTYTFQLHPDIYFHSDPAFGTAETRKITASDFVYSFTRICDPATASSGQWVFNGKIQGLAAFQAGEADHISGFEVVDDTTFTIRLTRPFPPFLGLLAMPYCKLVPEEAITFYGESFRSHPVGTGPFRIFRWTEGSSLVLHKNPDYFATEKGHALPYLDAIKVTFIGSRLTAFMEFSQGNLDMLNDIDPAYKDEILSLDGTVKEPYASQYQCLLAPQLNTEYLGMQTDTSLAITQNHPFRDVRVRQALNYAIDRRRLVTYLLNGKGYPAESGFVPNGMPGFDAEAVPGYTYSPQKAAALLAEAGYPGGAGLPELTLNSTQKYAAISEYIQKAFEQIGVSVQIQNLQGGALRTEVYGAHINFWRASWIADYPEAENYLALFHSSKMSPKGPNTTHFNNARYDSLYDYSLTLTADTARHAVYHEMERIMLREAPVILLYYDRSFRLIQRNISGLVSNPMNFLSLKRVRKGKE